MTTISFDLINNAKDSLRHAVNVLVSLDAPTPGSLKQAILSVSHAAELLLKERLRIIHPAFVWENVDRYPALDSRTVNTDRAVTRLESLGGISFSDPDKSALRACRVLRNAIEHYEFTVTRKEAKVILGKALSFVFDFATRELGLDLEEDFKQDSTWECLLEELYEFAQAHGERLTARLAELDVPLDECRYCGQTTVDLCWQSCKLCGHLWEADED